METNIQEKPQQIKMVEYFDEHWYKVGTDYYPSVTTKLGIVAKDFLAQWRGDIGNREANMRLYESQMRGTRIHKAWETLTTGGTILYNPWRRPIYNELEIENYRTEANGNLTVIQYQDEMFDLCKLKKFLDVVKPKIVASETIVYDEQYKEAGTIDNVFEMKEGLYQIAGAEALYLKPGIYIADLKTGSTFSDEAYLQMAAYAKMYEKLTQKKVVGTLGLHTQANVKSGIEGFKCYLHQEKEIDQDYADFRHASDLWLRKNKNAKPRIFEIPTLLSIKLK